MSSRPLFILLVWLGVLAGGIVLASVLLKGRVSSDLSQFLPQQGSSKNQILLDTIRANPATAILLVSLRGNDTQRLAQANKALTRRMRQHPFITQVVNGEIRITPADRKFLLRYHYLLNSSLNDSYFSAQAIKVKLTRLIQEMSSPAPLLDKSLLRHDPLLSIPEVLQQWIQKSGTRKQLGVWFDASGKETLIFVRTHAGGFDINKQQQIVDAIKKYFAELNQPAIKLTMSGPGFYAVEYRYLIKQDIVKLSVSAGILVCLLLLLVYRSLRLLLFTILPLATAITSGILAVIAVFGGIHGITLAFGITLIGMTIDYPIHLFTHIRITNSSRKAIDSVWPTLRLGIITTALGFVAMLLAGFEGLRQLAVFAISGLLFAGIVTRWVLPYVVPGDFYVRIPRLTIHISQRLVNWSGKLFLLFAALGLIALVVVLSTPKVVDHDLKKLSPLSDQHRKIDRRLRRLIGTEDSRFVLAVTANNFQTVLERIEALQPGLEKLVQTKVIRGFDPVSKYLPSLRTQRQRQQLIPDPAKVTADFKRIAKELGVVPDYFKPFYADLAGFKTVKPLDYTRAMHTPLALKLQTLVFQRGNSWLVLIPLKKVLQQKPLKDWARQLTAEGVRLLDIRQEATAAVAGYVDTALWVMAWGTLVIIAILWAGLRSLKEVAQVVAPIAAAILSTVMIWLLFGVKLNIFHLVSLLLVVGIGIDYALFFNRKTTSEDHQLDCLAIWVCNLTTVIVFGLLFFSFQPVLIAIGGTVALGAFAANWMAAATARVSGRVPDNFHESISKN